MATPQELSPAIRSVLRHECLAIRHSIARQRNAHREDCTGLSSGRLRVVCGAQARPGGTGATAEVQLRKNPALYDALQQTPQSQPEVIQQEREVLHSPVSHNLRHKPEVLAPAGGWPQLRAAVENGADAVYFGLSDFSARARAANFTPQELPEVMAYLHERGVKGYVALNVLVFDEELVHAEQIIRCIAEGGVDAVIVQDIGVVRLLRAVAPSLPIHGSTQMSITSPQGAEFAAELGVSRVVVGRELSVKEIAAVRDGTRAEVEAFVHGALCVSYSGQCWSSEAWGGRSANRGQCAQACRMPYGLLKDGVLQQMGDVQYLLSPQDLAAVEQVPDLIQAGVSCFKIEGRLKGPEYVALTTQVYRRAVDDAWGRLQEGLTAESSRSAAAAATERDMLQLRQLFARGQDEEHSGLTPGFLEGPQHQSLVRGRAPRHRGVLLGRVTRVLQNGVVVEAASSIEVKAGDGVVFDSGRPQEREEGGSIFAALDGRGRSLAGPVPQGMEVRLEFGPGMVNPRRIQIGDRVWRNKDAALEGQLRRSYEGLSSAAERKLPVDVHLSGRMGEPLVVRISDDSGTAAAAESGILLQASERSPLSEAALREAVGQLGANALALRSLDVSGLDLAAGLFLPKSALKAVRREAAAAFLAASRWHSRAEGLAAAPALPALLEAAAAAPQSPPSVLRNGVEERAALGAEAAAAQGQGSRRLDSGDEERASSGADAGYSGREEEEEGRMGEPLLRVLCRSKAQVDAALAVPWLRELVLDFLEVQGLREAVAAVQAAGRRCVVATPRILKPGEGRLWRFYLKLRPDALLLRSAGLLQELVQLGGPGAYVAEADARIPPLEGDFSLNAANAVAAAALLDSGLSRLALTHDLNAAQLCMLARNMGPRAHMLEVVAHQHLPIFHTEHCVFCRFLSDGNSYLDCGHPCEKHTLELRDHEGRDHLVLADMGCRNTVFNAQPQSGASYLPDFLQAGFTTFRIELVGETPATVAPLLERYRAVLRRRGAPSALWAWLRDLPGPDGRATGVTRGSLETRLERPAEGLRPTAAAVREGRQR